MMDLLIISFVALFNIGNAQATTFLFDGILDLYTGSILTDSANVVGDFTFTDPPFNDELSGIFTGNLFGLPVTGDLTIPTFGNPVTSSLTITWNGNILTGDLLLDFNVISLELFEFTSLDGDNDGIPGSVFDTGPKQPTSLALSGQFSAVTLPSALWLFGSGVVGLIGFARRKKM